jgi:hypothetical protein
MTRFETLTRNGPTLPCSLFGEVIAMKFAECRAAELYSHHITETDADKLVDVIYSEHVVVARFVTGFFVEVGAGHDKSWKDESNDSLREFYEQRGFSSQFMKILDAAQSQGLGYLRIHSEGEPTEGLEVFTW